MADVPLLGNERFRLASQRVEDKRKAGHYAVDAYCRDRVLVIVMAIGLEHRFPIAKMEVLATASDADLGTHP